MSGNPPPEPPGSQTRKVLPALAVVASAVIGLTATWVGWERGLQTAIRPISLGVREYNKAPAAAPIPHPATSLPTLPEGIPTPSPDVEDPEPMVPPHLELQSGKLPWELQIEAVLGGHLPDREKALQLIKQLGSVPPEAFTRVTEEAVSRLPDNDYPAVLPLLLNPNGHGSVQAVLYEDLLERPDGIVLPALLSIAQTPRHPFAGTAREGLIALLDTDHGADWSRWRKAVARILDRSTGK